MSKNFKKALYVSVAALSAVSVTGISESVRAESSVEYKVPVKLMKSNENALSMGNQAIDGDAKVVVENGKTKIYITVKGLKFMGMFGHLTDMQVYENGPGTKLVPASVENTMNDTDLLGTKRSFPKVLKIERNKEKESRIYVKISVDAMDSISSGGATSYESIKQGAGAQNAVIELDYSKAVKITPEKKPELKNEIKEEKENKSEAEVKSSIQVKRISGNNRYATSADISKSNFKSAETVVIANGNKEADALAAAPLASLNKAPILLVSHKSIPSEIKNEIKRLGTKNAIIAGGEGSVSSEVADSLKKMGIAVQRVSGADRYSTATEIGKKIMEKSDGKKEAIVVNGRNYADALAVSALATKNLSPILLTDTNVLNNSTKEFIKHWRVDKITVVGGTNSVSDKVMADLSSQNKSRISGNNRYSTSVAVAKVAYPNAKSILVASGTQAADALSAGAVTYVTHSPLVLVEKNRVPSELANLIKSDKIDHITLVGGTGSISESVEMLISK